MRLPLIVGMGGFNTAGRGSFHQAYKRVVLEELSVEDKLETLAGLASMMRLSSFEDAMLTLRREHEPQKDGGALSSRIIANTLVRHFPSRPALTEAEMRFEVPVSGQLPSGFDPSLYYPSRFHPRGIQLSILGASDAICSLGIDWDRVLENVSPDEIAVYAGSVMAQLDRPGYGGMMQARLKGQRVSSKNLALGLNTMPADFINAYVLGSLGATGSTTGACATFLYNLKKGVEDIQSKRRRVVIVGNSEAPLVPEIIEGYAAMGALATQEGLLNLAKGEALDYQKASRPFGENCGFVLAESSQFIVLMDDELALELGAHIYAAVPEVFINADGFKKSISSPGVGNYVTMAKGLSLAQSMMGTAFERGVFVMAHGSSTPQNRRTESVLLSEVAKYFGLKNLPIVAAKAHLGHSLSPASGDQLALAMGVFDQGILPGIQHIDQVADDVEQQCLSFVLKHRQVGDARFQSQGGMSVSLINSKGFGGNNATALVLAPNLVRKMLSKRYGQKHVDNYYDRSLTTDQVAAQYHAKALRNQLEPLYRFEETTQALKFCDDEICVAGYPNGISLRPENRYQDLIKS